MSQDNGEPCRVPRRVIILELGCALRIKECTLSLRHWKADLGLRLLEARGKARIHPHSLATSCSSVATCRNGEMMFSTAIHPKVQAEIRKEAAPDARGSF
jgi:hypothetical protein